MSLVYDPQELKHAVGKMFAISARTHPDPNVSGVEQSIACAKVHEHLSLDEAINDSPDTNAGVKPRVVLVSHASCVDGSSLFYVRKGRENKDGSIQIGRTWGLETLTSLDVPPEQPRALILGFKKPYYWVFGTCEQRSSFESILRTVFHRFTGSEVPAILIPPPQVPEVSRRRTVSQARAQQQAHQAKQAQEVQEVPQSPHVQQAQQEHLRKSQDHLQQAYKQTSQPFVQQQPPVQQPQIQQPDQHHQVHTGHNYQSPLQHQHQLVPESPVQNAPTPPPHAKVEPLVAPLRNVQRQNSPAIPNRAPSRSSKPDIKTRSSQRSLDQASIPSRSTASLRESDAEGFETPPPISQSSSALPKPSPPPTAHSALSKDTGSGKVLQPAPTFMPSMSTSDEIDSSPEKRRSSLQQNLQFSPLKSPTGMAYRHRRSLSGTPLALSSKPENRQLHDFASVIEEFKWEGTDVTSLEKTIKSRLEQIAYQNFSGVVNLDSQLDEINEYVKKGIEESNRVDAKMQAVAMNLVGKGDDMTHIEGRGDSDSLQILALNYRKLATEIEKLLEMSRLDEDFISRFQNVEFGNPESRETPIRLRNIEEMLVDLNQALEMFSHRADNGDTSATAMKAFQEPKRNALQLAANFGTNFQEFFEKLLTSVLATPRPAEPQFNQSLEYKLFSNLYIYTGCLIFVRDTVPNVYNTILHFYEREMRKIYQSEFTKSFRNWSNSLEQLVGKERGLNNTPLANDISQNAMDVNTLTNLVKFSELSSKTTQQVHAMFSAIIDNLCIRITSQQCFIEKFFHLGSEGTHKFTTFVSQEPLPDRRRGVELKTLSELAQMTYFTIDASKSATLNVLNIMQTQIFPQISDIATRAVMSTLGVAPFESVYLAMILDIRSYEMRRTNQQFLAVLLAKLHKQLSDLWEDIARKETRHILNTHFTTKKRVGVHPVVIMFTRHVSMIETSVDAALKVERARLQQTGINGDADIYNGDVTRQMIDRSHGNMFRAIAQGLRMGAATSEVQGNTGITTFSAARLKAAARETAGASGPGEETKELLNRHVVMIENLYQIFTDLERFSSIGVQSIVLDAKQHYQRELESYIADVISRPVGKIVAFVNQHEARSTHPVKQKESVSALKRVVKGYDVRELRSGVEQLRKRVEKHFSGSDPAVFGSVWRAIYNEYLNLHVRMTRVAQNLDAVNYMELQRSDITAAFNL